MVEQWIVDRLEGDRVVVERPDGTRHEVLRELLPARAREGDVISVELGADPARPSSATVDRRATRARREALAGRVTRLKRRDPGGDVRL
jgi:hypothetical protein